MIEYIQTIPLVFQVALGVILGGVGLAIVCVAVIALIHLAAEDVWAAISAVGLAIMAGVIAAYAAGWWG